jgi:hypothetical protein
MQGRSAYHGKNIDISFELNLPGVAAFANNPKLEAALLALAKRAQAYAMSISPLSDREHRHYVDSFEVSPGHIVIAAMRRVTAELHNTAPHAAAVEWGNAATRGTAHHVIRRTLDHLEEIAGRR